MNADERLRILYGALARWRAEAQRLWNNGDFESAFIAAYVYAAELADQIVLLETAALS